jgi:hypothetical protein
MKENSFELMKVSNMHDFTVEVMVFVSGPGVPWHLRALPI